MSYSHAVDPCRIIDSDSEDEEDLKKRIPTNTVRSPNPTPKTLNWAVEELDDDQSNLRQSNGRHTSATNPNSSPSHLNRVVSSASSSTSSMSTDRNVPSSMATDVESLATSSSPTDQIDVDIFHQIREDRTSFIYQTLSPNRAGLFQCRLQRDSSGVQGNFHPTFYLQAERSSDARKEFLLAAKRVTTPNRTAEYVISTNIETLSRGSRGDGYVGKLRGNNIKSTEYTLYSNGLSPNKHSHIKSGPEKEKLRKELASIIYNTNFFGIKGPRQIHVVIPKQGHAFQPSAGESTILSYWRERRFTNLIQLRNKTPTYNEATKAYVIQFTGNRVVRASVKNFQIVAELEDGSEELIMQFGRIDSDVFTCDYRYPLSAIQAFAIALSSFDSGIARE